MNRPATQRPSLDGLFRPRSIAVVGASRRAGAIGRQVVANLLAGGFEGPVYPVNPKTDVVLSMPTFRSVAAIGRPVDLAILVVPPDECLKAAAQCGANGVRGLVVVTAGFREIGGVGIERENKLAAIGKRHGMRIIGPNCMGILNTADGIRMNASFAAVSPPRGKVAMVSQSGALGEAILADAAATGLGVAMFASIGNRVDVEPADLIEYWEDDADVQCILLYMESFGDSARFLEVARRVARKKPILAVKSGRSAAGAAAIGSHTGSVAGADSAADTLLAQAGVLRVESFRDMFALAAALLHQPLPAGDRIAVVTNAGGPGILATDAIVGCGLRMATLRASTTTALRKALPIEASVGNPVDLIASADADRYRAALRAVVRDRDVDALLVMFVSPIMIDAVTVAEAIVEEVAGRGKTVLACLMGRQRGHEAIDLLKKHGILVYRYPEDAAATLRMLVRRRAMLARKSQPAPKLRCSRDDAAKVLDRAPDGWLPTSDVEKVLDAYGIPIVRSRRVADAGEAVAAAHAIGFPVVLKAEAPGLLHKSEHHAVVVGLRDGDAVFAAAQELITRLRRTFAPLTLQVQAQATGHREVLIGMTRDPRHGPLFAAGLGGTFVEVLRDVSVRLAPMDADDPREMFASLKGAPLLGAFRGKPAVAVGVAESALLRLQQLALDFPHVQEVEINPFVLATSPTRCVAVDARLRIGR